VSIRGLSLAREPQVGGRTNANVDHGQMSLGQTSRRTSPGVSVDGQSPRKEPTCRPSPRRQRDPQPHRLTPQRLRRWRGGSAPGPAVSGAVGARACRARVVCPRCALPVLSQFTRGAPQEGRLWTCPPQRTHTPPEMDEVADVGAAVEAADGQVYTGACIGGFLSVCAEAAALSHLVAATAPTITRVVAVWKDPSDGALYVIPPCGRCRELMRTLSQKNLEATVILGPDHTATVRDLLPHPGWHAERVRVANAPSITAGPTATRGKGWVRPTNGVSGM
jgi:cytidine deaminase